VGPNPTDRGKNGTKRSLIVEADGGPLGCVVAGANVNDHKLLEATIQAIVVERPDPKRHEQHLCLDKGYDNTTGYEVAESRRYTPHIRMIGQEKLDEEKRKRHPARRWVVERTLGWLNRWRAILVRYAKKSENYLAMIQLACVLLWYRRSWRLINLR
jgi:putative transposase